MKPQKKRQTVNTEIERILPEVANALGKCARCPVALSMKKGGKTLVGRKEVYDVLDGLIGLLFPGCHGHGATAHGAKENALKKQLLTITSTLMKQTTRAFEYQCKFDKCRDCDDCRKKAEKAVIHLIRSLPKTRRILEKDIVAAYEGDPAAKSTMEVVMSYPGVEAVITHRIAHLLHEKGVFLLARIMAERAHSRTGIDIHPGAKIGPAFFIDHGTGVVIGETSVIGKNVKLYQGVTLGAVSFPKDKHGNPVKGVKRHPNVEDNVVIYAEATILGNITLGASSEIGGNVWLTHSVPPNSKVHNQQPKPIIRKVQKKKS